MFGKKKTAEEFGRELSEDFFKFLEEVWELAAQDHGGVDNLPPRLQHEGLAFTLFTFDISIQADTDKALRDRILDGLIEAVLGTFPNLPNEIKQLMTHRSIEYAQVLQTSVEEGSMQQLAFAIGDNVLPDPQASLDKVVLLQSMFRHMHDALGDFVEKHLAKLR